MTPEQKASDLVREIITRSKSQPRFNHKTKMKELQDLAKTDLKAKKIYDMLLQSVKDIDEDEIKRRYI